MIRRPPCFFFFFYASPTTEIYTLSLHDALPIYPATHARAPPARSRQRAAVARTRSRDRSEEHTSELQSRRDLVCRLQHEKKKQAMRMPGWRTVCPKRAQDSAGRLAD